MANAQNIREFIDELPDDAIFTSRDLLHFGSRNSVDCTTHRLVYLGLLKRLARGVFMKDFPGQRIPSMAEVANIKAKAFGKEIFQHGINAAAELGIIDKKNFNATRNLYYTTGCSSSFQTSAGRVSFKSASRRKIKLANSDAGKLLKAVWQVGKQKSRKIASKARFMKGKLDRLEKLTFIREVKLLPEWISKIFYPKGSKEGLFSA